MNLKIRDFDLSVKAAETGRFSGHASLFGIVDSYNERVMPGAFAETIAARKAKGRPFPILWQHKTDSPVGPFDIVEEDSDGLYVEGRLLIDDVAQAREALSLMKAGVVTGMSIGYWTRESSFDEKTGIRSLLRLDLEEISLVTIPALDDARVDSVKRKLANGGLPTVREFEMILREAGFSRSQAATIASHGFKHIARDADDRASNADLSAIVTQIESFSLPRI
jgi:HK97 family phage prohead protease